MVASLGPKFNGLLWIKLFLIQLYLILAIAEIDQLNCANVALNLTAYYI